jgi:hypothetical protein
MRFAVSIATASLGSAVSGVDAGSFVGFRMPHRLLAIEPRWNSHRDLDRAMLSAFRKRALEAPSIDLISALRCASVSLSWHKVPHHWGWTLCPGSIWKT